MKISYPQEVLRITESNSLFIIDIDDIVDRCYVTTARTFEKYLPNGIPADQVHICGSKYEYEKRKVRWDNDVRPYIENVNMKNAFRKRNTPITLKRKSLDE